MKISNIAEDGSVKIADKIYYHLEIGKDHNRFEGYRFRLYLGKLQPHNDYSVKETVTPNIHITFGWDIGIKFRIYR